MSYQNIMSSKLFLIRIVNAIFKSVNYWLNSRKTFISNVLPFEDKMRKKVGNHLLKINIATHEKVTIHNISRQFLILIIIYLSFNTKKSKKR